MSSIKINNLSFAYEKGGKLILKDINTEIHDGEFVCILGQSGCGKSTLLRLLAGLETATEGEILNEGEVIGSPSLKKGVVFQDYGLFPWMTAEIAINMIKAVGLDEAVYKKLPKELSGGMKQRCAIAQAFSIDPPILLMDEPFGALDAVTRARLQDLIRELWAQEEKKKTVFFVTHDVDEALLLANRILVLGQSPSHIIYDVTIPEAQHPTRDTLFENMEMMKLRMALINQINKDVTTHI